ncbi:MAG TPA: ribosome rescue GTPase HflX [Gammaproteobacteria bacterium]
MFERPRSGERALLVHVDFPGEREPEDLQEFSDLAASAGADPVAVVTATRSSPDPKFFVGSGKAEEIRIAVAEHRADVVLFNHTLSPSQERNLEKLLQCRVLDRTGLILDIFAQRARSFEGKLQVELAQLQHLSTRLVRGWSHLERQKGGIGLRGPGETQLETDRRLLGARIKQLHRRLEKVQRQRAQGRRARSRAELSTVSLVGYTNAGKSTLFNILTGAGVYAADQLFATLDPTLRRLELPEVGPVILADTVGFVRHLPHDLVAAFRATLEETRGADLLLHVVDASDPERSERIGQVNQVLQDVGAAEVPQLLVYNKLDRIGEPPRLERDAAGKPVRVWVSALSGAGLELLREALAELLAGLTGGAQARGWLCLPASAGRLRADLFRSGAVRQERFDSVGRCWLELALPRAELERQCARQGVECRLFHLPEGDFLAGVAQAP